MTGLEGIADSTIYGVFQGTGLGIAFLIVRWLATFIASRWDKKEAQLDEQESRLNKRLESRVEQLTTRLDNVEAELADCRRLHAEERAERLKLEALMLAKGEIKQQTQMLRAADKLAEKAEAKKAERKE